MVRDIIHKTVGGFTHRIVRAVLKDWYGAVFTELYRAGAVLTECYQAVLTECYGASFTNRRG